MHSRSRNALGSKRSDQVWYAIAGAIGIALGAFALVRNNEILAFAAFAVPLAATVLLILVVVQPLRVNHELARFSALPFDFDLDTYLALLAQDDPTFDMQIRVTFANAPPERAQTILETMGRAARLSDARWSGQTIVTLSVPAIDTSFSGPVGSALSYIDTSVVHRWFLRSALPLIFALHACSPITRVDFYDPLQRIRMVTSS